MGERSPTLTARRRGPIAAASATVVILVVVAAVFTTVQWRNARDDARGRFDQTAGQTSAAVEREVTSYFDKLRDIGGFVSNVPGASGDQFAGFVEQTRVFDQLKSLVGIFFIHRVEEHEIDSFVAAMRQGNPDFTVLTPIGNHPGGTPYYVLTYYVPGAIDLQLPVGTDIVLIPSVIDLLEMSNETGKAIAGSFQNDSTLRQIAERTRFPLIDVLFSIDFFIAMPVYSTGQSDQPIGWVGATVDQFEGVVWGASRSLPEDVGLRLSVDLTSTGTENVDVLSQVASIEGRAGPYEHAAFRIERTFEVENITWRLAVWSGPDADAVPLSVPAMSAAGIAISILAAGIVYLRMRSRQRDRALAAELADREQFQRDIVDSVANAMVVLDATGTIVAGNAAWAHLRSHDGSRVSHDELGRGYLQVLAPKLRAGAYELNAAITQVLSGDGDGTGSSVDVDIAIEDNSRRQWFAVRATPLRGRRGGAVVVHTDITERKRTHEELELRASRDDLTGLLNRAAFESEVTAALVRARADNSHVGVLFIDLDGFKGINDTYGHAVGDDVLRTVAQRISGAVRSSDRVARLGGDEFVVLIAPLESPTVAEASAARILAAIEQPVRVNNLSLQISASIGIAAEEALLSDSHKRIIQLADEAMYRSKSGGGGKATSSKRAEN
ncbi:MAG: diguanylate cyclase [Acidimicrobiales bacterium]|nr:diguanylate cyclase [Acidimicrobiales bacterium]